MLFKRRKEVEMSDIDKLAHDYFQCIYYLTETDLGDGQKIDYNDVLPTDISVDKNDPLIINSSIGVYNLHIAFIYDKFIDKCINNIIEMTSKNNFDLNTLNKRIQDYIEEWW